MMSRMRIYHSLLTAVCLSMALLCTDRAQAQLVINEACTKNSSVLADATGEYTDWVELYNAGTDTIALGGYFLSDEKDSLQKWSFTSGELEPGGFVIAFASGQPNTSAYHTNFELSSKGESVYLSGPQGQLLDVLAIPALDKDHSFGRHLEGSSPSVFTQPTPFTSNTSVPFPGYTSNPVLNEEEAFFSAPIRVAITTPFENATIRYTLDGSIPMDTSAVYADTLIIESTTVLRVRAFSPAFLPSRVITHNYFIGEHTDLPVVAISSNPGSLWDPDTGIYIIGPAGDSVFPFDGANFWQDWERYMHMEMYLPGGELAFSEDLGFQMHGGQGARPQVARPFRILAKKAYGATEIDFQVFPYKDIDKYDRLVLRNSGSDFNRSHFRDGFISALMIKEGLDIDLIGYRPVRLYLNGEYWGLYNLRERIDNDYIYRNHPEIGDVDLDLLEEVFRVREGDSLHMLALWEFMTTHDLADETHFQHVEEGMDLSNVADYFIAETYINNKDWPNNNLRFWRPRTDTGKWRYMMFDLDESMNSEEWNDQATDGLGILFEHADNGIPHAMVLQSLVQNPAYRDYFINRYADLINTSFLPERILAEIDEVVTMIEPEIPLHFQRWRTNRGNMDNWYFEIERLETFAIERPEYARQYLQDEFDLPNQVNLHLNVSPPGAGSIQINTIQPKSLPWEGIYYNGVPVTLTIQPNPGYTFTEWKALSTFDSDASPSITYNFETDEQVTAYFSEQPEEGMQVSIYPTPSETQATLQFVLDDIQDVQLSVQNTNGNIVYSQSLGTRNAGLQRISLDHILPDLNNGVYIVTIRTPDDQGSTKLVRLHTAL